MTDTKTLLIVDDEPMYREILKKMISRCLK